MGPKFILTPNSKSLYRIMRGKDTMQEQPSRRDFLAAAGLTVAAGALQQTTLGARLLLKGGCVLSLGENRMA